MASDRQHPAVLNRRAARRAAVLTFVVLAGVLLSSTVPAEAHNQWKGAYRKWPWKAGESRYLTTLPGQCPHCPGVQSSSAWRAIDAAMNYETVYAISPGRIDRWEPSGGAAGKYLRIRDDDGTYITYEHLSKALVTSGRVLAGWPIAVSGCTGNCSGPHLHFQRHDAPSFNSKALPLARISGHGGSEDPFKHTSYMSDNAGIAAASNDKRSGAMRKAYEQLGGYDVVGATSQLGVNWSPCRTATWFRYACSPSSEIRGSVQTYRGPKERQRALMYLAGAPEAYMLHRGILAAYTERIGGKDWVHWIGYPVENRRWAFDGGYVQNFQYGFARYYTDCTVILKSTSGKAATYSYCD